DHLGSKLDRARAARMVPGRTTSFDLQAINRRTGSFERGKGVSLGVEDADGLRIAGPVAALTVDLGGATADAASDAALLLRLVAFIGARDFEQSDIAKAAIGIALRCRDQARQKRRAHVGHVGCDRVGKLELVLAAAEQFGLLG